MSSKTLSQYMNMEYGKHLPWNNVKPEDLGPVIVEFVKSQDIYYRRWALKWFENFQFLFGNQNIRWSKRYDYATDFDFLRERGNTSFGQKSFTNITRTSLEALMSVMFGSMPDWDAESMSESSAMGRRIKHICIAFLDAYTERLKMQQEYQVYAATYALFGAAAIKMEWDPNAGTIIDIPKFQKVMAPLLTNQMLPDPMTGGLIESPANYLGTDGQPAYQKQWRPLLDSNGRPVFDKVFTGDIKCEILSPFQYRRPLGSYAPTHDKYIEEILILDYDEWLEKYGKVEGKTSNWNKIKPIYTDAAMWSFAVQQYQRLQLTTPPVITDLLNRTPGVARLTLLKSKVIVIEHYDKPSVDKGWPMGRRVVVSNGLCTHVTTPQYTTNKRDGWHPYSEAQWMRIAPSNLSPGPINDVVQKNKELNVTDTVISTAMRRNLGSQLLFKKGAGFDQDQFTGEPGATMEVNDPFAARWLHDDMPIPPVVFNLRQTFKEDAYEMSGAGDALRGERSPGATSGYQAKQYEEREQKRLTVARSNFDGGVSGAGEKLIQCLRQNVTHLDEYTIGFLKRAAAGKFTVNDAITFMTSPIDFGVDVKIKKMSMAFKSKATQQADVRELAQGPLAQRVSTNAKVMDQFVQFFDVGDVLRDESSVQRDRAARENETFLDLLRLGPNDDGVRLPLVIMEDDDDLHEAEHTQLYVEHFEEISENEYVHQQFLLHMETHRTQKKMKQGEVANGSRMMAPQSYALAQQAPKMDYNQVAQQNMQLQQMKMMQQQQQGANAQAPQPSGAGQPGQPQVSPEAPSSQTPTGANPATRGGQF